MNQKWKPIYRSLRESCRQILLAILLFHTTIAAAIQVGLDKRKVLSSACEIALHEGIQVRDIEWENDRYPKDYRNSEMRMATANVITLFNYEEEWRKRRGIDKAKPLQHSEREEIATLQKKHLTSLADFIKKHELVAVQEADGFDELMRFNRQYLNQEYYVLFPTGAKNPHHQHNVFFIRKNMNFRFVQTSYTNVYFRSQENHSLGGQLFPHDFPVLEIYDRLSGELVMVVANTHLKLQRKSFDSESARLQRKSQLEIMQNILKAYKIQYGGDLPIVLLGDFNENMCTPVSEQKPHFQVLTTGLLSFTDVFNLFHTPREDRATSSYVNKVQGYVERNQRDAILVSGVLNSKSVVSAPHVFRYRQDGKILQHPVTQEDYLYNTFDHFPVSVKINLDKMRKAY